MGAKPVTVIWGIGNRTAARLGELGIVTVEDLARSDHEQLARSFGPTIGPHLRVLGLGGDDSPIVDEPHVARGRSREETFTTDVIEAASVAAHVERLARDVTADVVAEGRRVTHVAVKVRTSTFFTSTKISKLQNPSTDPDEVAVMAMAVLSRFGDLRPVRLLGVRVVLEMPP
jgi:DNA polymerase-4